MRSSRHIRPPARWQWLLIAAIAILLGSQAAAAPTSVVIRVPAGSAVPLELAPLLAEWRQSGKVADALWLTDARPEESGDAQVFEALAVLEFPSEASCSAWMREGTPSLPPGLVVRQADAMTHGEISPRDSNLSVFVVNIYTPTVSRERYSEFVEGYIAPLWEGIRATKGLVRYTMYLERGAVGKAEASG